MFDVLGKLIFTKTGIKSKQFNTNQITANNQALIVKIQLENGEVVGCGARHVLWEDLAEVRTVAVIDRLRGTGVGHRLMQAIEERAREIGVKRIFCLTFETQFFGRHGFEEIEGTPVDADVYAQMLRSYDAGIAEFLDLESVKPNTLGNTRMLKKL